MSRWAWLTPDDTPSNDEVHYVHLPGGSKYTAAFRGAFLLLMDSDNWERFGLQTPSDVAAAFADAFAQTLADWDKPMWSGEGQVLASHAFVTANQTDVTETTNWTPFDQTNLKLTVVSDRVQTVELHWIMSGQRVSGAPASGYLDMLVYDGAYQQLSGNVYGSARLVPGTTEFYHLVVLMELQAATYHFYLGAKGGSLTYPCRIPADIYTFAWAIRR